MKRGTKYILQNSFPQALYQKLTICSNLSYVQGNSIVGEKVRQRLASCARACENEAIHDLLMVEAQLVEAWRNGVHELVNVADDDHRDEDNGEQAMAGSVNKVILVGNLGADPEIRHTQDGRPIAHLRIATSETWRDRATGERRERTEWHRVVIFSEGLARIAEQYLRKGSKVYLEGQLQTRKWVGQDGVERYTTEVVLQGYNATLTMLDSRNGGMQQGYGAPAAAAAAGAGFAEVAEPFPPEGMGAPAGGAATPGTPAGSGTNAPAPEFAKELDDDVPF